LNKEQNMAKRMIDDKAVALARRLKRYFAIGNAAPSGWEDADEEKIAEALNQVLEALRLELKPKS
jgi:hypothetical protein